MTTIVISSGHGKYVRGASGYVDEVDQARRVVEKVAEYYRQMGVSVYTFHDDVSASQSENLNRIVEYHNSKTRDLDISVHFNAYETTSKPMGCEVLYVTQESLASKVSSAIASAGDFINRGPKYRSDLAFLNGTEMPAALIETCFVDSKADTDLYGQNFDEICGAIAESTSGRTLGEQPPEQPDRPDRPEGVYPILSESGKVSWFGGPEDTGVSPSEGLAFIYDYETAPYLFLPYQPSGTTGLARRLDPEVFYIAMRWDYDVYPKELLASGQYKARVRAPATGKEFLAWPADWGPHKDTDRVADISQGLLSTLGIETDDDVEVTFPHVRDSVIPPTPPDPPDVSEPIPPPPGGGWGWHPSYGWGYFPMLRDDLPRPPTPGTPGPPGMIESEAPIAIGDEGDEVTQAQQALVAAGHDIDTDGDFGSLTQTAVETFQASRRLPITGYIDPPTGAALDRVDRRRARKLHATAPGAPWVSEVRACTGVDEIPGSADSPIIMAWRLDISHAFPEMAQYTAGYTGDDIAWCGFGLAGAMARSKIKPPYDPTDDTGCYLWALAWADWGRKLSKPKVGCVMVFEREGGGHVAILEKIDGNTAWIRGFNQSDSVNVTTKSMDSFVAAVWPEGWPIVDVEGDISNTAPPGSES
jgi:N-acetylmuramoyl-L-alanine amidase